MATSKCQMKVRRTRWHGQLVFTCQHPDHHHERHPRVRSINEETIFVDPDELYATMTRKAGA